ncbi:MAG: hypothetical protein H7Y38_18740 [Armatimonadetes bacterium]|nr:hypothetical protein [Armatimonadota bacterium]
MNDYFSDFHVVLVEPQNPLNIGSVARAMMNLGFRHLHLVAPQNYDRETANVTACWATPILDGLTVHETLADAISDCETVIGLGERPGQSVHFVTLPQWAGELPQTPRRKTALLFGSEDSGLRQEHFNQCRYIARIPSTEAFPSFNLAQSVLLVLWEITQAAPESPAPPADTRVPTWNDFFQLDRLLDSVMTEGGFVRSGSPGPAPEMVKNLFRRLDLSPHEIGLLLSLFGRLQTTLRRNANGEK